MRRQTPEQRLLAQVALVARLTAAPRPPARERLDDELGSDLARRLVETLTGRDARRT